MGQEKEICDLLAVNSIEPPVDQRFDRILFVFVKDFRIPQRPQPDLFPIGVIIPARKDISSGEHPGGKPCQLIQQGIACGVHIALRRYGKPPALVLRYHPGNPVLTVLHRADSGIV